MRIKFKKGATIEAIVLTLQQIIQERGTVIGAVNVYIQEYGDDMKAIKDDGEYLEYTPGRETLNRYAEYSAEVRRSKMKAV